jgi:hypothetical protein
MFTKEFDLSPTKRFIDMKRKEGKIWSIGDVDVDVDNVVARTFLCDRHRCIQWTPHETKQTAKALIDNSCCSRYQVPVTDFDVEKTMAILPLVKKRLPPEHRLNADPNATPFDRDVDFTQTFTDTGGKPCQFVLYEEGLTTCAIHKTLLEENMDVWENKPLTCSLWPVAFVDWDDDGDERFLLTAYVDATKGLFDHGEDDSAGEDEFACLVDQNPDYEPLYQSMRGLLEHLRGTEFYRELDERAKAYLAKR